MSNIESHSQSSLTNRQHNSSDVVTETLEKTEPSQKEMGDFKLLIEEWFKLDDQIRKLSIAIKERKKHQAVLDKNIKSFMTKFDYDNLNTSFGSLKFKTRECVVPVKIKKIKDTILENTNLSGQELVDKIFQEERQKVSKQSIRRVIPNSHLNLQL
jgi:uncharacterized membrane-anchored protein YjiN (DUF445 family)